MENKIVEKVRNTLNIVEEVLWELKTDHDFVPEEGNAFDALHIVEKLLKRNLISWDIYHLFISEERSNGNIPCCMKDGTFQFPFIDCSEFKDGNLPSTPEDEMYLMIYNTVNRLIGNK